jgi:hypothetical protein
MAAMTKERHFLPFSSAVVDRSSVSRRDSGRIVGKNWRQLAKSSYAFTTLLDGGYIG